MRHRQLIVLVAFLGVGPELASVEAAPAEWPLAVEGADASVQRAILDAMGKTASLAVEVDAYIARLAEKRESLRKSGRKETRQEVAERRTTVEQLVAKTTLMKEQYTKGEAVAATYRQMRLTGEAAARRTRTLQDWSQIAQRYEQVAARSTEEQKRSSG